MSRYPFLYFALAILLLTQACRPARHIQEAISKKDTIVAVTPAPELPREDTAALIREQLAGLEKNRIRFTTFSAKLDVDYRDGDGKKYDVNAHLRMYLDSVIWISITGPLGIEGLRALITADSVKLLDKQNKVYIRRSVSYLQDVSSLPLDLTTLQQLLLGNPVFLDSNILSFSRGAGTVSLQSSGSFFKNLLTVGESDKLTRSSKLDDQDEAHSRTCYLTYEDYEDKKGIPFSTRRMISVTEKKKLEIRLHYKQYELNETLSFPFSVPKNYKYE